MSNDNAIQAAARALAGLSWELNGNEHAHDTVVERRWPHYVPQAAAAIEAAAPLLRAEVEREIVELARQEAGYARVAQNAGRDPQDKLYRMGQKDALLLFADQVERGDHCKGTDQP